MKCIELKYTENTAILTINREKNLNALNNELIDELSRELDNLAVDNRCTGIIITGKGTKAFVAGADIKQMQSMSPDEARCYSEKGQKLMLDIEQFSKPVIAAVNGYALGGGCEIAMACHIRIAVETAKFSQPEASLGLIPGFGGTQRLPRLVGRGRAMELLFTGKMIDAHEAKEIGLVNEVCASDDLLPNCLKMMSNIYRNSPVSIQYTIKTVNQGLDTSLEKGLETEAEQFGNIFSSQDHRIGIKAFLEKKRPVFCGK